MRKNYYFRLLLIILVISVAVSLCVGAASADDSKPMRTLPPLPTMPGKTPVPAVEVTPAVLPTEAPVKLESRSAGSDVNLLFIIGYVLVFTVPLIITLRNMTRLRKLDRDFRRRTKKGSSGRKEK